jgi:hypothetical protein
MPALAPVAVFLLLVTAPPPERVVSLVTRVSDFDPRGPRTGVTVVRIMPAAEFMLAVMRRVVPADQQRSARWEEDVEHTQHTMRGSWMAEVRWAEGGQARTGVFALTDPGASAEMSAEGMQTLLSIDGWGITPPDIANPMGLDALVTFRAESLLKEKKASVGRQIAVGNLRIVASAEMAFQSARGGYYGAPECLYEPTRCIPEYVPPDPEHASFLGRDVLGDRHGYRIVFHGGPQPAAQEGSSVTPGLTDMDCFAVTAVPIEGGPDATSYCIDSVGSDVREYKEGGTATADHCACVPAPTPRRLLEAKPQRGLHGVSANEEVVIGELRMFSSAEAGYQSANGGYFGQPECLVEPARCLSGYGGPAFLEYALTGQRWGYDIRFVAGPPVPPSPSVGKRSLRSWAITAQPLERGVTGSRSFCEQSDGIIVLFANGVSPSVTADGNCNSKDYLR